jgi:hypothetical protein
MRRSSPGVAFLAAAWLALAIAGCQAASPTSSSLSVGGSLPPGGFIPVIVNEEFGVGPNHLVMTTLDADNVPIASPDRQATLQLTPADGGPDASPAPVTFEWGITGTEGFYVSDVVLPTAGSWAATVTLSGPGSATASSTVTFDVKAKTSAIAIGQPAPSIKTPTAASVGGDLKKISTDPNPDPHFYETSEDAALAAHKPFVLVFATPAFCQSATCGPALDHVKTLFALYPDVTFIHVEPYEMTFTDGRLQPTGGQLTANAITNAWGILSEPWVYVVDKTGIVRASFPSVFTDQEFKAALDAVK